MSGTCLCGSDAVAKGLCNTCYQRNRRAHPTITVKIPIGFAWGGFAGCRLEGGTLTRPHSSTNTVLHFRFFQDGKWLSTDAIAPALKEASLRRSDRIRKERETLKRLDDAIKRGE